jgi:hypothetical protein
MRTSLTAGLLALAIGVPTLAAAQELPNTQERAAVQRVLAGYAQNVQSGNLAAVEALFAPACTS